MRIKIFVFLLLLPNTLFAQPQSTKKRPDAEALGQKAFYKSLQMLRPNAKEEKKPAEGSKKPKQAGERPPPIIKYVDRFFPDPFTLYLACDLFEENTKLGKEKEAITNQLQIAQADIKWLKEHTEPGDPKDPRALLPQMLPWHKPLGYFAFMLNAIYAFIVMRYALKHLLEKLFREQVERRFSMALGYSMFVSTIGATVMPGLIGIRQSHFGLLLQASMVVTLGAIVWPCLMIRVGEYFRKRRREPPSSKKEMRTKMRVEIQKEFGRIGTNLFVWFVFGLIAYGEWQRAPFAVFGLIMEMILRLPQVIQESKMEEALRLITGNVSSDVEKDADPVSE